jgi:succinate-semialdehyde dehydrogenase/glutarate-semialdehyde dehydrogenase
VDAAVHDRLVEACLAAAKDIRLGHPFEQSTNLGPLNKKGVAAKMDRHLLDASDRGASVLVGGGRRPELGSPLYYDYTVLDGVTPEMAVAREESFGQVLPILSAASDDELIALANADALGLQAAVFTRDLGRAFRYVEELQVGQVIVNDTKDYWNVSMPFGGAGGRLTGWARIGEKWTLMDMTDLRTAVFHLT